MAKSVNPGGRKPTLVDALARVARAGDHIASLESNCASSFSPNTTTTIGHHNAALLGIPPTRVEAPPILSILVGETIYNLRAALDYLVYELVYLDTGKPLKRVTQFPIVDTPQAWNAHIPNATTPTKKRSKMWLHRLSPSHQAGLYRLQPCNGCTWTKNLSELSNPDKHRRLTFVEPVTTSAPDGANTRLTQPTMTTYRFTGDIALEDGALVIQTLKNLQQEVTDAIRAFEPDFK
jgi:hypothetical protein